MKTATAQAKLNRVNEQIGLAQSEVERIDDEIEGVEKGLTAQLAKLHVDDEAVATLEDKRTALTTSRARLQARVTALQDTIPGIEAEQMAAELAKAKAGHKDIIQKINDGVELWEATAREIENLAAIAADIRKQRRTLADVRGHVRYLAAATGADMPELNDAAHVSNEVILSLRSGLRESINTEGNAYYRSIWDERAQELDDAKREQERVTMREAVTT